MIQSVWCLSVCMCRFFGLYRLRWAWLLLLKLGQNEVCGFVNVYCIAAGPIVTCASLLVINFPIINSLNEPWGKK